MRESIPTPHNLLYYGMIVLRTTASLISALPKGSDADKASLHRNFMHAFEAGFALAKL